MSLTFGFVLGFLDETCFSLLGVLGRVLFQQPEKDVGLVFVEGFGELGNQWGNFDSGEENSFLSLEGDVLGPSDESGQISFGLNIVADSKIARPALEERIRFLLDFLHCSFSFGSFTLKSDR